MLKALYEEDLFPRIIAGSSVGAIVASILCSHKYSDVWKLFDVNYGAITSHLLHHKFKDWQDAIRMLRNGESILDNMAIKDTIYKFMGDRTFLEIYDENRWNLNITVTDGVRQGDAKLLNYLTAPNIVIWSAV